MEDKASTRSASVVQNSSTTPVKKTMKSKSQRIKASHPPTSLMVTTAIKELKDRKGSSLQAIKKYIASTYKVDGEKLATYIKRYLKTAVTTGTVVQTKGKGASGSFKLSTGKTETHKKIQRTPRKAEPKKVQSVEKKTAAKKPAVAKKPAAPKKPVAKKKPASKKAVPKSAPKKTSEAKNMSKTRKTAKAPAAMTKTPKPKKALGKNVKSAAKK